MSRQPSKPALNEKNEYIPSFITKKPFWVPDGEEASDEQDYLQHQRLHTQRVEPQEWYKRGKKAGPAATKYRKGACENCGAMTHKTKECLSRPRAQGAKITGRDIEADEVVQDVRLGWDAKRDRWNGYDAAEYRHVVEDFEEIERIKKKVKLDEKAQDEQDGEADGDDQGESKYAEESDMGRHQSTATRNLRLREDTAKYLVNLDLESAKYDPKTRSMIEAGPNDGAEAALIEEENFVRASGDAAEFEKAQRYAWETQERGDKNKVHLQANPTSGEFVRKKQEAESKAKRESQRKALLDKYGGNEHLQSAPLAHATENERYVEYDEDGGVKGLPKPQAKSKYPEDVYINNHTSVWGSWWSDFQWGYDCCHSTTKNSYCTGEQGKAAWQSAEDLRTGHVNDTNGEVQPEVETHQTTKRNLLEIEPEKPRRDKAPSALASGVTEEELEEYKRKRTMAADPMAKMLGRDEVVH